MQTGLTLIEMTVMLMVLLALVTVLLFGARGWKRGYDRTGCIVMTRCVQVAVRSYQNINGYSAGGHPDADHGSQDIGLQMLSKGYIEQAVFDALSGAKPCPGGGSYTVAVPDIFPPVGQLYMACSLASLESHTPPSVADW